jgi:ATP-dependent DNA helicase RecG
MPDTDLSQLLAGETERIEWKESLRNNNVVLRSVCALANDLGGSNEAGYLVIGIKDNGTVLGLPLGNLDEEQQLISNWLRSTKIYPHPSFSIEITDVNGLQLLIVRIEPYAVPPVITVDGVCWVRKGSTTVRATEADQARLRERRPENLKPFDTRLVSEASLADLATGNLREEYETERADDDDTFPSFTQWLTSRQLGAVRGGRWHPNAAALLIHGVSPQDTVSGAFLELVRYGGIDVDAVIINRKTVSGTIISQLEAAWQWLEGNLVDEPTGERGVVSEFSPEYPLDVLKELVRNTIQHRQYEGTNAPARIEWYSDRIELTNPGSPFGRASEGEFGEHSDYRNPLLTGLLVRLGYVERLGRGVRRVRKLLRDAGLPPLEVVTNGFTRATVRRRP